MYGQNINKIFKTNSNLMYKQNNLLKLKIINYTSQNVIFSFLNIFLNEKLLLNLKIYLSSQLL